MRSDPKEMSDPNPTEITDGTEVTIAKTEESGGLLDQMTMAVSSLWVFVYKHSYIFTNVSMMVSIHQTLFEPY